jgi:hypothetical protein
LLRCYRLVAALQPRPCTIDSDVNTQPSEPPSGRPEEGGVMGQAIPRQHPAVVLRSRFNQLRTLFAAAVIAVVGLTVAVVILATHDDRDTSAGSATQVSAPSPAGSIRYDGGPEEGTPSIGRGGALGARADGGAEKGTSGVGLGGALGARYDGGPEEGTGGPLTEPRSPSIRYDGGPEEGSADTTP